MGKHKHKTKSKKIKKHKKSKTKYNNSSDSSDDSENDQIIWTENSSNTNKDDETKKVQNDDDSNNEESSSSDNEQQQKCELFDLLSKTSKSNSKNLESERNKKEAADKQAQIRYSRELNSFFRDDVNKKFIENADELHQKSLLLKSSHQEKEDDDDEEDENDDRETIQEPKKNITDAELNTLHAKLIKAQMLGNTSLIKELEEQIKQIKAEKASGNNSESNNIRYKIKSKQNDEKVSEDKMSVKELFLKTKNITAHEEAMRFVASTSKIRSPDDEYEDIRVKKKAKLDVIGFDRIGFVKSNDDDKKCNWCLNKFDKHLVLRFSYQLEHCFVALTPYKPFIPNVCHIISMKHTGPCSLNVDHESWSEIRQVMRKLSSFFDQYFGCTTIFTETFFMNKKRNRNLSNYHFVIECIPIKKRYDVDAKIFFHKAILESGEEWSINKKLIKLEQNPITRKLPKGLAYFWVSIGPEFDGFAHVIEDEDYFDENFAKEVINGLLDVDESMERKSNKQKTQNYDEQLKRIKELKNKWRDFI